jgi:membrane fusion protein (multidrug efflux system)
MRYVRAIIAILLIVGGLVAIKGAQIRMLIGFGSEMKKNGPSPEAVGTTQAKVEGWEGTLSAVGSVASTKGVTLSADAAGVVRRIYFESGAMVKAGQVLVELDTTVERPQLAAALARTQLAKTTASRTKVLFAGGAISAEQADADDAALRTSITDVEGIRAQIAKKTVRAPFAGRLGIKSVNVGQYLNPGAPIAVLGTFEDVHVDFTVPQQRLADVKVGLPVRITVGGDAGKPLEGKIAAADPTVDAATRTVKLRADVVDKEGTLRPGMFVAVDVVLPTRSNAVVVPATAVVHAPYGDSVFVVEETKPDAASLHETPDGRQVRNARQQFVKVGRARGDYVVLLDGVKANEEVVSAGSFKLRNGVPVYVNNTKGPTAQLDPFPENR